MAKTIPVENMEILEGILMNDGECILMICGCGCFHLIILHVDVGPSSQCWCLRLMHEAANKKDEFYFAFSQCRASIGTAQRQI